jgi:hypothetical protein
MFGRFGMILGAAVLLSSCSHYYYAPNTENVPLFKEKNEVRFSGSVTVSDKLGGDIQAGYAITKNAAMVANASFLQPNADKSDGGRGYLYELGAGYFKALNSNKERLANKFIFEAYGVVGVGGYKNFYWDQHDWFLRYSDGQKFFYPNNYISSGFVKAYVQPSIGYSHSIVDVIISARIGLLHSYRVHTALPDSALAMPAANESGTGTLYTDWTTLNNHKTPFLFEPAFTLRIGWKYVKMQAQFVYSPACNPFMENVGVPFTISTGLSIGLAPRFKKNTRRNPQLALDGFN